VRSTIHFTHKYLPEYGKPIVCPNQCTTFDVKVHKIVALNQFVINVLIH
jgi:hypothetical protein